MNKDQAQKNVYQSFMVVLSVVVIVLLFVVFHLKQQSSLRAQGQTTGSVTCKDVTSYDYNWDNDVRCTRPDGSTFYTSYGGADKYGYDF